jgi:hypothetical protein
MISADDVRARLNRRPFQPFRIHLTDRMVFDIRHPELAAVTNTTVVIGIPSPMSPTPGTEYNVTVALFHITWLEPIVSGPPVSSN